MGIISVCLDCPHYQTGGWCRIKQKTVSALAPACEDSKTPDEDLVDDGLKTCRKCGRVLPKEKFSKNTYAPDGLQPTCKDCAAEAFKAWSEKQKKKESKNPMKEEQEMETTTQTKRCPKCGRDLPRDAFHPKLEAKDGLQSYCKECARPPKKKKTAEPQEPATHKTCGVCGRELPVEDFYLKNGKPDYKCKECAKKYNVALARKHREAKMAQMNAGATTKVCKTCGRELPLDAFGAHAKTWDHKATVCLECMRAKLTKTQAKIKPKKAAPAPAPAPLPSLADVDTSGSLENYDSRLLVAELRARGYHVTCEREIKTIESL